MNRPDIGEEMTVYSEIERLRSLYAGIPRNKMELAEGLIEECAKLRVELGKLWADIEINGEFEMFRQSSTLPPYERLRPQAQQLATHQKTYHAIIKTLDGWLPAAASTSKLADFLNDDSGDDE